jgi:hypothetical protein
MALSGQAVASRAQCRPQLAMTRASRCATRPASVESVGLLQAESAAAGRPPGADEYPLKRDKR